MTMKWDPVPLLEQLRHKFARIQEANKEGASGIIDMECMISLLYIEQLLKDKPWEL
jgi:hypothetical protein